MHQRNVAGVNLVVFLTPEHISGLWDYWVMHFSTGAQEVSAEDLLPLRISHTVETCYADESAYNVGGFCG